MDKITLPDKWKHHTNMAVTGVILDIDKQPLRNYRGACFASLPHEVEALKTHGKSPVYFLYQLEELCCPIQSGRRWLEFLRRTWPWMPDVLRGYGVARIVKHGLLYDMRKLDGFKSFASLMLVRYLYEGSQQIRAWEAYQSVGFDAWRSFVMAHMLNPRRYGPSNGDGHTVLPFNKLPDLDKGWTVKDMLAKFPKNLPPMIEWPYYNKGPNDEYYRVHDTVKGEYTSSEYSNLEKRASLLFPQTWKDVLQRVSTLTDTRPDKLPTF